MALTLNFTPVAGATIVWSGAWSSIVNYVTGNVVSRLGSTYIAVGPSLNIDPSTTLGIYWALMTQGSIDSTAAAHKFATGSISGALQYSFLTASDIPDISATYLPLAGGTLTGTLNVPIVNITTGLKFGGAAPSGYVLRGNGTYFVGVAALAAEDLSNGVTGVGPVVLGTSPTITTPDIITGLTVGGAAASGQYLRGNGTRFVSAAIAIGDLFSADGSTATNFLSEAGTWLTPPVSGSGSFGGVSTQTGDYQLTAGNAGSVITFNISSLATLKTPAAVPASPWAVSVENQSRSTAILKIIVANSESIDGETMTLWLNPGAGIALYTDGSNYFTMKGGSGGQADWFIWPGWGYTLSDSSAQQYSAASAANTTANKTLLMPFYLDRTVRAATLWFYVNTQDNTAHKYDFGIYSQDGTLLASLGAQAGSTFAGGALYHKAISQGTVILTPGKYYFGWTCDTAAGSMSIEVWSTTSHTNIILFPNNVTTNPLWFYGTNSASGILPAATGVPTMTTGAPVYNSATQFNPILALSGF